MKDIKFSSKFFFMIIGVIFIFISILLVVIYQSYLPKEETPPLTRVGECHMEEDEAYLICSRQDGKYHKDNDREVFKKGEEVLVQIIPSKLEFFDSYDPSYFLCFSSDLIPDVENLEDLKEWQCLPRDMKGYKDLTLAQQGSISDKGIIKLIEVRAFPDEQALGLDHSVLLFNLERRVE